MHEHACENNFGPLADRFEYASSCQPLPPILIGPKPFFPCPESHHVHGEEFRLWKAEALCREKKQSGYDSKPGRSQNARPLNYARNNSAIWLPKASSKIQPTKTSNFFIMPDLGTKASKSRPPLLTASIIPIHLP